MLKRKLPLLFSTIIICLTLILSGCTPKTYQLSTSVTPNGGGMVSPSAGPFQSKVTLVATPAQNYEFIGWAGSASGNTNPLELKMDSDKQVVAQFKRLQSTIQVNSNPSDGGTVRPGSGTFDTGSTAMFTVTPNSGYRFNNWGGDASGNTTPLNLTVNGNKILTANFIKQYILNVTADPNAGTINQKGGIFDAKASVNLNATPVFPYAFSSWSGTDNNNVNPTIVTMNADKSVTVIFQKTNNGDPQRASGNLAGGDLAVGPPHSPTASTTINLKQYEWVQGAITLGSNPPASATIQDPNGKIMKSFGSGQANFTFMAEISGPYIVTFTNNNMFYSSYDLTYTIYHLP